MLVALFLLTGGILNVTADEIEINIEGGKVLGTTGLTEGKKNKFFAFKGLPYAEPPARFEKIEINIGGGKILGTTGLTEGQRNTFFAFKGLPYAEPPARFELPIAKKPWSGVLNCTYDKNQCVQHDELNNVILGSEDCLYLSVYTTNLKGSAPVLAWIHGGAFLFGNASYNKNPPDFFLDEGVVVVQLQYRLGIFGFLSTEDTVCPGNLGLKDQVLALQWIKNHIHYFGGDPKKVTIMGQSAGGGSVGLHLTSPKSKGLFKGAIMNSGVSLCSWSLNRRAARTAFLTGTSLGIFTSNSTVLVNRLKEVNYTLLQERSIYAALWITLENPFVGILYGPVIEVPHPTAFFTGKSEEMLSSGNFTKVPVLVGFTSNETAFINIPDFLIPARIYLARYDIASMDVVPVGLTNSFINKSNAAFEIKREYFGKHFSSITLAPFELTVEFLNVDYFVRPINKFILDVSKYVSNTYYYMFSYVGDYRTNVSPSYEGVSHSEDLNYLFGRNFNFSTRDQLIRLRMVRMWSNFCKFSKPIYQSESLLQNARWLPASSKQPPYLMNINSTLASGPNLYQKRLDFYESLYKKWGQGENDTFPKREYDMLPQGQDDILPNRATSDKLYCFPLLIICILEYFINI